jgi:hypothetical protein
MKIFQIAICHQFRKLSLKSFKQLYPPEIQSSLHFCLIQSQVLIETN